MTQSHLWEDNTHDSFTLENVGTHKAFLSNFNLENQKQNFKIFDIIS